MAFKIPKIPYEYRRFAQDVSNVLRRADNALDVIWKAREGTLLEKGLAGLSIVDSALDLLIGDVTQHDQLIEAGYQEIQTGLSEFLCQQLRDDPSIEREDITSEEGGERVVFWSAPDCPRAVAAIYRPSGALDSGPYVAKEGLDALSNLLQRASWARLGNDLDLTVCGGGHLTGDRDAYREFVRSGVRHENASKYALIPLQPCADYIGEPTLAWYADRLARYGDAPRVIRLLGPTGVGKSTLARNLGRAMGSKKDGEARRTLRVTAAVISRISVQDILDLAKLLHPDVLLLDDLRFGKEVKDEALAFLEALHLQVPLTILTHMAQPHRGADVDSDDDERTGMRPGRIDETFRLPYPSSRVREKLLIQFFGGPEGVTAAGIKSSVFKDLVERTEKLTGAYLQELVRRLVLHGPDRYKTEVNEIVRELPKRRRGTPGVRRKPVADRLVSPDGKPRLENWQKGTLERYARENGLDPAGTKGVLILRVAAHVAAQPKQPEEPTSPKSEVADARKNQEDP